MPNAWLNVHKSTAVMNYFFSNMTNTIETKEAAHIGYNGFLFPHEYSGEGRGA
jgi:hypothetical protein